MNRHAFVICTDENYSPHAGTCLFSLLLSTARRDFDIHVISASLSDSEREKYQMLASIFHANIMITDGGSALEKLRSINKDHALHRSAHISDSALLRLCYAEVIEQSYGLIAYIDCDIIIQNDATCLFQEDLGGNIISAVPDLIANRTKSRPEAILEYFNSGVLLINDQAWRSQNIQQQLRRILEEADPKTLPYADQDILNQYFRQHGYQKLANKYNYQTMASLGEIFTPKDVDLSEAVVVHFAGQIKPWQQWSPAEHSAIYEQYRRLSPWRTGYQPQQPRTRQQLLIGYQSLLSQGRHKEACLYGQKLINLIQSASSTKTPEAQRPHQ